MKDSPEEKLRDLKTEEALLGAVIIDADIIDAIPDLDASDFYLARHAVIYETITEMHDAMDPVDFVTLANELKLRGKFEDIGGHEYLMQLTSDTPSSIHAPAYARTIKRLSWLRHMLHFATGLANGVAGDQNPEQLWGWAQIELNRMMPAQKDGALLSGPDTISEYRRIIDNIIEMAKMGEMDRWKWPRQWRSWEKNIRPMRPGQMAIITAADGVGKSTYLSNIAENWAMRGNQVVLVHFEDDHEYKLHRRMARWSGIPLARLEDGTLTADDMRMMAMAENEISQWTSNLHYLHAPGWTMAQTIKELQRLKNNGLCDMAVVDYIDKAWPDRRQMKLYGDNVWARQSDDAEQLKSWADRTGTPMLTATQGNKNMIGSGRKSRKDISGSGGKSQKSQLIIILTRETLDEDMTLDDGSVLHAGEESPIVTVQVDKQNRGRKLIFQQFFDGARYRVIDMETQIL